MEIKGFPGLDGARNILQGHLGRQGKCGISQRSGKTGTEHGRDVWYLKKCRALSLVSLCRAAGELQKLCSLGATVFFPPCRHREHLEPCSGKVEIPEPQGFAG